MTSINPYLNFSGNCEEAFEFYRSIFGGELDLSRFSDAPPEAAPPDTDGDLVLHVSLILGEEQFLMGSDRPASMGPTTMGDSVHVNVRPDSTGEARRIFDALAEGGEITMPLGRTFWGADFGMLTDRFGINWLIDHEVSE